MRKHRVVVLTGPERVFFGSGLTRLRVNLSRQKERPARRGFMRPFAQLELPKTCDRAVSGAAAGYGCSLALASDVRLLLAARSLSFL